LYKQNLCSMASAQLSGGTFVVHPELPPVTGIVGV
jgi:hypothetical protein